MTQIESPTTTSTISDDIESMDDKSLIQAFISREIEHLLTAFAKCIPEMREFLLMSQQPAPVPVYPSKRLLH